MNKNTQHIVALSCLIIAGSVVYYLFKYIPEQNKITLQHQLQKECLVLGAKEESEDEESTKRAVENGEVYIADYIFNEETNACLHRSSHTVFIDNGKLTSEYIKDLFTNKTLEFYIENNNGVISGSKGDFLLLQRNNFR